MLFLLRKVLKRLSFYTFNTIYFNFKYFPLKTAIKFPVYVASNIHLMKTGGKVRIGSKIVPGMIQIGFSEVGIFDKKRSRGIWQVSGLIVFEGTAILGHGVKISCGKEGSIVFGNNFKVSAESAIVAHKEIIFGADCLLSWDVLVMDTDFHKIRDLNHEILNSPQKIVIGNKVWITCRSLILKGSVIPNNTIIGAASLCNKDYAGLGENCIIAGNPAKKIKEFSSWNI